MFFAGPLSGPSQIKVRTVGRHWRPPPIGPVSLVVCASEASSKLENKLKLQVHLAVESKMIKLHQFAPTNNKAARLYLQFICLSAPVNLPELAK